MDTLKEAAIETIKKMPDGCSIEDILYELNFMSQVLEGIKDADNGNTVSTGELLNRVEERSKKNNLCFS